MWRVIRANLEYQGRTAVHGLLVVLLLATAVNVLLPILGVGPSPQDDFKLYFFYPVLIVFLGVALALADLGAQRKESRLRTVSLLPLTQTQVGSARILSPVIPLMGCLALGLIVMLGLQLGTGTPVAAWRFYFLSFFAGLFLIVSQAPVMAEELRPALRRSRALRFMLGGTALAFASVMVLRALSDHIDLVPEVSAALRPDVSLNPELLASSLLLHGLGWILIFSNIVMFRKRTVLLD